MPRLPARLFSPFIILLVLTFASTPFATALPLGQPGRSVAERSEATPSLFSKLLDFLSAVWVNGSGLEPDGVSAGPSPGSGTDPNSGTNGDNGSGLEPNG